MYTCPTYKLVINTAYLLNLGLWCLQTKHDTSNTEKQDVEKLKSQLKELEEEIVLKSKLLAAKQDHVKELQQMLAAEQAQKDLIVKGI